MIIKKIPITEDSSYEKLWDHIPAEYLSLSLMDQLKSCLSDNIRVTLIEYPYIDKDYRSTYYNFYAKRHRSYDPFCFRLHFFSEAVDVENLSKSRKSYMGSIVLRPTEIAPLGRTLLIPEAIRKFTGYICEAEFKNHILGVPFEVATFPHMMQDSDVTVCAHAVCWMIVRYFSEKYPVYPERLTYDIVEAVRDVSLGRNIPSRGLTLGQVSEILSSIGFYPEIFVKELYQDREFFYDILFSYVESGIPIVAAMREKEHAVAVFGHGNVGKARDLVTRYQDDRLIPGRHLIDSLIVNDDNGLPFQKIHSSGGLYSLEDVDAFIVPLYEKMYLNAENVLHFIPFLMESSLISIDGEKLFSRIFMTSSRSYKREINHDGEIHPDMLKAQLELPMPKFIWVIELSVPENYDAQMVDYRWIVDSTANQYESFSFLFLHDKSKMIINDRALTENIYTYDFTRGLLPYKLYTNNLQRREA